MAYIGHTPAEKYVSLSAQHFTVTATANYTLSNSVTNENEIALFINNVRQQPGGSYAYTAAGTTLTLSAATAGTDTMYCVYLGKAVGTISPPDGSVNSAKIVDGSITDGDLAGSISSAKITSLDATKLTGTVAEARLATLDASKLTGSIADARVPASAVTQHASDYIAWQAVVTAATLAAVAGRGYPINTTSNACTVTLPAAASAGDTIKFVDYARTWATNAVTINQNSLKFQGWTTPNPVLDTDGQSVTFVYVDVTQGWLPLVDDDVPYFTAQSIGATGGTIVTYTYNSVDYKVHKITSSGANNFVVSSAPAGKTIDILVIAGGGGGSPGVTAANNGGGGGAGGLRWFTAQTPTASTYTATVGAGGAGGNTAVATSGTDSTFTGTGISITANGGGRGGYSFNNAAAQAAGTGGSGGGSSGTAAAAAGNEGSFTPVEGFIGGTSTSGSSGGGGGGSKSLGLNGDGSNGGHGGDGQDNFSNQSSTAFTIAATKALLDAVSLGEVSGSSRHIAGGGGGGGAALANGGLGGGGDGLGSQGCGTAGTVNTGSGGGGGAHSCNNNTAGSGGSGIILVRYLA